MSRPATKWLAAALLTAGLAVPSTGAARQTAPQTAPEPTDQELMQRLDSLAPLAEEARLAARAAQAHRFEEAERDTPSHTILVGPVQVMVLPGDEDLARDVVGHVWQDEYAPWTSGSPDFTTHRMFFQWRRDPRPFDTRDLRDVRKVQGSWQSRSFMERGVREVVGTWLRDDLRGTALEKWASDPVVAPRNGAEIFRRVARAPSRAARSCVIGDLDACLLLTGIGTDAYPLNDWYDATDRRFLVSRKQEVLIPLGVSRVDACLSGQDETCDALLHEYSRGRDGRWAEPVHGDVRNSLLWVALRTGGEGAWSRLRAAADQGPRAALEAASGLDAHALAAQWRAWLLSQRPASQAGLGGTALGALFWILVLTLLAARSSRWRFG